ncbi:MAG: sialidase family protein [Anaerolineae bacterium]
MTDSYLRGHSDSFLGQRRRLPRYLVCALEGYFPVLVRTGANDLAIVFRSGATHVGISGTLATSVSHDGGISWSDPVQVAPRWNDDRNPAMGMNAAGELITAFWRARLHSYQPDPGGNGLHYHESAPGVERQTATFITRSADQGKTWTPAAPYESAVLSLASPFGRIITLPDGTCLLGLYGAARESSAGVRDTTILVRSRDGGITWGEESLVAQGYNETSYLYLPSGQLLAASRSESGHVAVLSSDDGGYHWSKPRVVTRVGEHPADLTLLQSGRILLTFGRRIRPLGAGSLLSGDNGQTWDTDHEVLLAGDGILNVDLGYPSTVQLADGHIVTVLYYASGSEMSQQFGGWGDISCQAIHYTEGDVAG